MNKIFATMAVAALAAWAAPASAGVIFSDPGGTLTKTADEFTVSFNAAGFFNVKLAFDYDGQGGVEQPCGSTKGDCLTVTVNTVDILDNVDVPDSTESFGPALLGMDDQTIDITFSGFLSSSSESIVISNVRLLNQTVAEPAPLALFGLGLAGLGYMRRKKSS